MTLFQLASRLQGPFQRCFDRGGDDTTPPRAIHIAHTRSQCLVETGSASFWSCTGLGEGSSQFPRTEEEGGLGGNELMFDVDADLEVDDTDG